MVSDLLARLGHLCLDDCSSLRVRGDSTHAKRLASLDYKLGNEIEDYPLIAPEHAAKRVRLILKDQEHTKRAANS
jgi:hypothetical protein